MTKDTMRTISLGTIGTFATITLTQYSAIMAAIAGTATALFAIFKCVDWVLEKLGKPHKHKKKHT